MPAGREGRHRHRRLLEFRLAGNRIHLGRHQGAHPGPGRDPVVPVDGREHLARGLVRAFDQAQAQGAPLVGHAHQVAGRDADPPGIVRMHGQKGFRHVGQQTGHQAGAGHGVPLVAHPAGVEQEGMPGSDRMHRRPGRDRHHARLAGGGEEAAVGEQAGRAPVRSDRPLHRRQGVVGRPRPPLQKGVWGGRQQAAEIEVPAAAVLER